MRYLTILFWAVLVIFLLAQAQATIIHVPDDQSTIQAGINASSNGDTVLVAPNTYYEHINFNGRRILLTSQAGPESTIISKASDNKPMVIFNQSEDNSAILEGFTIENAYNPTGYGGAIDCFNGSHPTIRNNIMKNNRARWGGGVYLSQAPGTVLINNTIVDNRAETAGGGVYVEQSGSISLVNNIIVGSTNGYGIFGADTAPSVIYCDVWDNSPGNYGGSATAGTGCISTDPLFCDPSSDDYFLSGTESPCVGSGQAGSDIGALGIGCGYLMIAPGDDEGGAPYSQVSVKFYIKNIANFTDTFDLNVSDQLGWDISPTYYQVTLDSDQTDSIDFIVSIPHVQVGFADTVYLKGNPQSNPSDSSTAWLLAFCDSYNLAITGISDVGNDQGKQAHIEWSSLPGSDPVVTDFSVFRRKDPLLVSPQGGSAIDLSLPLTYPPGEWEWVVTVPAFGETLYSAVVPTLKDSTIAEGIYWSVFFIRAGTDDPTLYFDSPVDSGYSLDNLSPSPPTGLLAIHQPAVTKLAWNQSSAFDFDYYTVYRDTLSGFMPDPSKRLGFGIDTIFVDSTAELGKTCYYLVCASDFSGNQSDPSGEAKGVRYITGDANTDGIMDIGDVVCLLNYLFKGDDAPVPLEAGNANCDGVVDLGDAIYLLNYLFKGGDPPSC